MPGRIDGAADATLAEHQRAFADQRDLAASISTISRAIASLPPPDAGPGVAVEAKTISAAERDPLAHAACVAAMDGVDTARLVFVDEAGTHTSMTRRRSRAPRGSRAHGRTPRNRGVVTTLITGLSTAGMGTAMTIEGATTTAVFTTYLHRVLLPTLAPGTTIVVDNLATHHAHAVAQLVTAAGCHLAFLTAYSPDYSPVEEAFSKIKTTLRAAGARTHAGLDAAIATALDAVSASDAAGWFTQCGYPTPHST